MHYVLVKTNLPPPPSNREDWVQSRLLNGVFHQLKMQEVGNKLVKRHKVSLKQDYVWRKRHKVSVKQDTVWRAVSHLGDNSS